MDEQILINHIFTNNKNNIHISIKSALLIEFEKSVNNVIMCDEGKFLAKIKEKDINLNDINLENVDELLNIIKYANDNFENMYLIISKNDNIEEENKKKVLEVIEKIKKYCEDNINPSFKIFEYEQKDICCNTIKYINSFYEN